MLVGIPKEANSWEGLGVFFDFLLNMSAIWVWGQVRKRRVTSRTSFLSAREFPTSLSGSHAPSLSPEKVEPRYWQANPDDDHL